MDKKSSKFDLIIKKLEHIEFNQALSSWITAIVISFAFLFFSVQQYEDSENLIFILFGIIFIIIILFACYKIRVVVNDYKNK